MSAQPSPLNVMQLLLSKYHAATVVPLLARIAELEAEVARHKQQLTRGHRGKFVAGAFYEKGEEVMLNGSSWRALVDEPKGAPPGDDWQLVACGRRLARAS